MRHIAMTAGIMAVLASLAGCGFPAPDTPLTAAAETGDSALVRSLLGAGVDPDGKDSHGLTPLVRASRRGHLESVKALLSGGAHVDLMDGPRSRQGWTPLMNAVHKGQPKVVRALIEAGADVNARTDSGMTALMLAAGEIDGGIVRTLLDAGADPHPGMGGSAVLTDAVAGGSIENVRTLLDRAPDLKLEPGLHGKAALWLARLKGRWDILELLGKNRPISPQVKR